MTGKRIARAMAGALLASGLFGMLPVQAQTPQEPQGTYSTSGTDYICGAFSYTGTTFASAFSALAAYTHACPYLASVSQDTCSAVTAVQARFNGSCAYIYNKTPQGGGDRVGGLINWTTRCPDQTLQNQNGLCVPEAPTLIDLAGATYAVPLASGGQVLRLIATVTKDGGPKEGVSVSISMQGEAGGSVTGSGTTDAGGKVMLDYTPPQTLVGASKIDKLRADCSGCSNSAHMAISVQGTPVTPDEESCEDPGQSTRNPIVATSGSKIYSHADLGDNAPHPLNLSRRYASRWDVGPAAGLGSHWAHNHAHRVITLGRQAIVQYGDGATSRFLNTAPQYSVDPASGGVWNCAPGTWCTPAYVQPPEQPPAQWSPLSGADTMTETAQGMEVHRASDNSQWLFDKTTGQALRWRQRNGWTYHYSYAGTRLTQVTNAFARTLSLAYNAQGQLTGATSPGGQSVAYGYDATGRLAQVNQADGTSRGYLYEDSRWPQAITAVVNEAGERYNSVAYDAQGRATLSELAGGADRAVVAYGANSSAITDALNNTRSYQYQSQSGRGMRTTRASALDASGNSLASQSLDAYNLVQSQTDFLGVTTLYTWDTARRLKTGETQAANRPEARTAQTQWHPVYKLPVLVTETGRTTAYTYDALGNKLSETITDAGTGQARTWACTYDERGLVASHTEPGGQVWTYVNGPQGLPTKVTNPLGHETRYQYDAGGRVTRIAQASLAVQTYEYDSRGRLVTHVVGPLTTRYSYTATGQLQSVTQPNGHVVTYSYDAAQRLTGAADNRGNSVAYTLDAMGNKVREEVKDASGAIAQVTARTISQLNKVAAIQGATGQTTHIGYDANGEPVSQTDPLNQTTRQTLDGLRRPTATTFADNTAASQAWNALDQLTQVTDPKGVATQYTYNAFGEVMRETSPDAGTISYERDANGRITQQTDARSQTTQIERDALGRPTQISRGANHQTVYTWDTQRTGYLARVEDPSGSIDYQRDAQGRITVRTQTVNDNPANPARFITRYGYQQGELATITYPSGLKVIYQRDATGQITGVDTQAPGKAQTAFVSNLTHTALGQPKSWNWSNGDSASRVFDTDGRMVATEFSSYIYDAASRITGITQHLWATSTATGVVTNYTTPISWTVGYDSRNRLTSFSREGAQTTYTYDANSNRLTAIDKTTSDMDLDGDFDAADFQKTTSQNLNIGEGTNRLLGFTQTLSQVRGTRTISTANSNVSYTLDAAGNLTSDGLRKFDYDEANRMAKGKVFKDGEEATIRYLHNALGQRVFQGEPTVSQTLPNQETLGQGFIDWLMSNFGWMFAQAQATTSIGTAYVFGDGVLPPFALLGEYDNGSASGSGRTEYIYLPTGGSDVLLVGIYRNGRLFSIHTDHLGTPRLMKSDVNKLVWQLPYSAFGATKPTGILRATDKPKNAMTSQPLMLKATGPAQELNIRVSFQYEHAETGLRYNLMRSSMQGHRYTQPDPTGLAGGINRFGQNEQNPLRYIDPTGEFAILFPAIPAFGGWAAGALGATVGGWLGWNVFGPMFQEKTPNTGEPGSWHTNPGDGKPGSGQERQYGQGGQPEIDIDWHPDHGAGKPHGHNWENGRRGPPVPLSPWPRGRIINECAFK